MAKVANMDSKLLDQNSFSEGSPYRRMVSDCISVGLTDSFCETSPRSTPASPDQSFVVTPDGKALPAVREIHVDAEGQLLVVERPSLLQQFVMPDIDSPTKREVPLVRFQNSPFADVPLDRILSMRPSSSTLQLKWETQPLLMWHRGEEQTKQKKVVSIINVDRQGVGHIVEVRLREYEKTVCPEDTDGQFMVEKDGTVHHAHRVFINTGEDTQVLLRDDGDVSGVFDEVPTPPITLTGDTEIIFISDTQHGVNHYGARCFVAAEEGTMAFNRVVTFPRYFPKESFKKALTYTAPLMLEQRKPAEMTRERVAVLDREGNVADVYNRILLADHDRVVLGYVAQSGGEHCYVADGMPKVVSLTDLPPHSPHSDAVFVCGKQCFIGANTMIASPQGLSPVARVVDTGVHDTFEKKEVSSGIAVVPGVDKVVGLPSGVPKYALIKFPPRLLLKAAPAKKQYHKKGEHKHTLVFVCDEAGPRYAMLYPRKMAVYDGVLLANGKGGLCKGHRVCTFEVI